MWGGHELNSGHLALGVRPSSVWTVSKSCADSVESFNSSVVSVFVFSRFLGEILYHYRNCC